MNRRNRRVTRIFAARIGATLLLLCCAVPALAQQTYDYGNLSGTAVSGDQGFILQIEGIWTNPRNADNVVATELSGVIAPIIPVWDDSLAGRLGLGYRWANGTKVIGTLWSFNTNKEHTAAGTLGFSIGPPIGSGMGDFGTSLNIDTEITARTLDLALAKEHGIGDRFILEWSVGFRYARYEETASGSYSNGNTVYLPYKNIENSMFGARAALQATYRWPVFSLIAGVGGSFLDGEVTGESGMSEASGSGVSGATFSDDGRSGNIFDFDVAAAWHNNNDSVVVLLGWEQQTWDGVPADMMRNLPGTSVVLRERDSVTFSGIKLGVHLIF